jgi:hypothetical protein
VAKARDAFKYCARIARDHYEFPGMSLFPHERAILRRSMLCRLADDILMKDIARATAKTECMGETRCELQGRQIGVFIALAETAS